VTLHPVPAAFRAPEYRVVDFYAVQLRIWAAKLIICTRSYHRKDFRRG
jgi:hypothetical protein